MPGLVTPSDTPPLRLSNDSPATPSISGGRRSPASKKPSPSKKPEVNTDASLDNPDLGPFLLKLARDTMISSGEGGPSKALEYALRASRALERKGEGCELELAMSLHVTAAIYCALGRHKEAVPVLERAVEVAKESKEKEEEANLAEFAGWMQLGDTHAMLGNTEESVKCYENGLEVQIRALGENDPRVAETCRYLAEAHVQALQFDSAEKLCKRALEIHREHSAPASLEEASDRRLMALILDARGDHDGALEHLVLASMSTLAQGKDADAAAIDLAIGDAYLSLARFDEAVFSYQKSLTVLKSSKGDSHPAVAAALSRLSSLYLRTGRLRESKSYSDSALRIYSRPSPGASPEEIAAGLTEIASIHESLGEPEESLKLLLRALDLLSSSSSLQLSALAGIEAQLGVIYYILGKYSESRNSFESAVGKLRAGGERRSAFFGVVLNQMGLACVQLFKIDEAAELFEEARAVLERECGAGHQDTLGVYSNLAAIYDAMGRVEDAIEILEHVLKVREEKLGTANPDVEDEKKRLAELLKEAGRSRNRKQKSLENLFVTNARRTKKEAGRRWSAFGFRSSS
ncbi:hypothetical protein LUZ60_013326 [Juncus effusus]|nr:hypothetical protein LUZ60_013326 [Juncus effusus]